MREHKMTEWDAGQDLIACADYLSEKESNLRKGGFRKLAGVVKVARLFIGRAFNDHDSHTFGLPDDRNETKLNPPCECIECDPKVQG